ncbi:MAG: TetR/AcrR family transcriptional regulator [Sphaerochaeta sp.]
MKLKISYVQQQLIDALLKLLKIYNFDEITITQLTQEACVARKTFYLNFKNKNQVLELYITEMGNKFNSTLDDKHVSDVKSLAKAFFTYYGRESDFINTLIKNNKYQIIVDQSAIFIENPIMNKYTSNLYSGEMMSDINKKYLAKYHAAGLWNLLHLWISLGKKETPLEMSQIYVNILRAK